MHILRSSFLLFLILTIFSGVFYPLSVTIIASNLFSFQAQGSILKDRTQDIGSILIGQHFTNEKYFWGRPSATADIPYNAIKSGGSNLGPTNPKLLLNLRSKIDELNKSNPNSVQNIPSELIFSSASGLDPEISLASALYQVPRIAKSRSLSKDIIIKLIDKHYLGRSLGFLGEPRVNVLLLNISLDKLGDSSGNSPKES